MLPFQRACRLVARLDLDVNEARICLACLTFVAFPMDAGAESKVRGETVRMTPDLWDEGLEPYLRAALIRAAAAGVEDGREALNDIAERGPRTTTARAAVRLLAWQLVLEMRKERPIYTC